MHANDAGPSNEVQIGFARQNRHIMMRPMTVAPVHPYPPYTLTEYLEYEETSPNAAES